MIYLFCSDIHGSREAASLVASLDNKYNFKKIFILGDVNYSGARNVPPFDYYPIDVCKYLNLVKDKTIYIRGNCDSRVDEMVLGHKFHDRFFFKNKKHHFYLTHGDLYNENSYEFNKNDVFLYGHTHVYRLEKNNEYFILNPGSMSLPKINKEKTYMIYDDEKDCVTLFDLDGRILNSLILK